MEGVGTLLWRIFQRRHGGESQTRRFFSKSSMGLYPQGVPGPPEYQRPTFCTLYPTWDPSLGQAPPSTGLYSSGMEGVGNSLGRIFQRKEGGRKPDAPFFF